MGLESFINSHISEPALELHSRTCQVSEASPLSQSNHREKSQRKAEQKKRKKEEKTELICFLILQNSNPHPLTRTWGTTIAECRSELCHWRSIILI